MQTFRLCLPVLLGGNFRQPTELNWTTTTRRCEGRWRRGLEDLAGYTINLDKRGWAIYTPRFWRGTLCSLCLSSHLPLHAQSKEMVTNFLYAVSSSIEDVQFNFFLISKCIYSFIVATQTEKLYLMVSLHLVLNWLCCSNWGGLFHGFTWSGVEWLCRSLLTIFLSSGCTLWGAAVGGFLGSHAGKAVYGLIIL